MRVILIAALLTTAYSAAAHAQNWRFANDPNGKDVHVTINFQISTPVSAAGSPTDLTKALTQANQSLYDIISHECDAINAAFKGDCKIVQLNVNGNINDRQFTQPGERQQQFVNANANATFLIETKDAPASSDTSPQKDPTTTLK
jgi:hypothetical protein